MLDRKRVAVTACCTFDFCPYRLAASRSIQLRIACADHGALLKQAAGNDVQVARKRAALAAVSKTEGCKQRVLSIGSPGAWRTIRNTPSRCQQTRTAPTPRWRSRRRRSGSSAYGPHSAEISLEAEALLKLPSIAGRG